MQSQRRLLPIAGFVLALVALVVVRVFVGADEVSGGGDSGDDDGAATAPSTTATDPATASLLDGLTFTDVTEAAGLDEPHGGTATGEAAMTAGAAVADVDADGDLDVFLT